MELESLNAQYVRLKKRFENAKREYAKLNNELKILESKKEICEANMSLAKLEKRKDDYNRGKAQIDQIKQEIAEKKNEATFIVGDAKSDRQRIEVMMQQLRDDPSLALHLDKSLANKYTKVIETLSNREDEKKTKRDNVASLVMLLNSPEGIKCNDYIREMVSASEDIKSLNEELKSLKLNTPGGVNNYTDPKRAKKIEESLKKTNASLKRNKKELMDYLSRKRITISEAAIDELKGLECKRKGPGRQLDVKSALKAKQKLYTENLEKVSKKREKYSIAYANLPEDSKPVQPQSAPIIPPKKNNIFKRGWNWITNTRFGRWLGRKKNEPEALPDIVQPRVESNEYKDSLKYDIVKDLEKEKDRQEQRQAFEQQRTNQEKDAR